jgi:hypothetical protein
MPTLKATHFEQVPLEVVKKILAEQSSQRKPEAAKATESELDENRLAASTAKLS